MSVFKKYISNNEEETKQNSSAPTQSSTTSAQAPSPASSLHERPQGTSQQPVQSQPTPTSSVAATKGRNVLSSDVEIKGKVKFTNDLVVDGLIEGEIISDGSLTVGENARIKAEIHTRSVVIYGKVHGNINVTDRVELKANAELVGDIKAATLSIEAGAIFVGKSTVGAPSSQPVPAKSDDKPKGNSNNSNNNNNSKNGKLVSAS